MGWIDEFSHLDSDRLGGLEFSEFYDWWKVHQKHVMEDKLSMRLGKQRRVSVVQEVGRARDVMTAQMDYLKNVTEEREKQHDAAKKQVLMLSKIATEYNLDINDVLDKFASEGGAEE